MRIFGNGLQALLRPDIKTITNLELDYISITKIKGFTQSLSLLNELKSLKLFRVNINSLYELSFLKNGLPNSLTCLEITPEFNRITDHQHLFNLFVLYLFPFLLVLNNANVNVADVYASKEMFGPFDADIYGESNSLVVEQQEALDAQQQGI